MERLNKPLAVWFSALVILVASFSGVRAGVIPGRWEKLEIQPIGAAIIVRLRSGERFEGELRSTDPQSITIARSTGNPPSLSKDSIRQILTREKRTDSLWNGALISAGLGALSIALSDERSRVSVEIGGLLGLIAIGTWIDASIKKREELYRSP